MKLQALPSHFEVIPPAIWQAFRKQVQEAASLWGLHVEFIDGPTVAAAQQRFGELQRIQENARLAAQDE